MTPTQEILVFQLATFALQGEKLMAEAKLIDLPSERAIEMAALLVKLSRALVAELCHPTPDRFVLAAAEAQKPAVRKTVRCGKGT